MPNPNYPKPEERVCYNCKYMSWMVALGLGVRCGYEYHTNTNPSVKPKLPMVPHLRHTCDNFEFKKKEDSN
jgi:hypothetical protein